MEERRKIVVPTGAEAEETPPPPHFDTEATMMARPVVPLDESSVEAGSTRRRSYSTVRVGPKSGYSPWLLLLVVIAAASVGAAAALAIDYYRNHQHAEAPLAAQPNDTTASPEARVNDVTRVNEKPVEESRKTEPPTQHSAVNANTTAAPQPAPSPVVIASQPQSQAQSQPETVERRKPTTRQSESSARVRQQDENQDEDAVEKPRARKVDEIVIPGERRQAREQRRRQRDGEIDEIPRQVNRTAGQELHRIREIFEGPRP